MSSGYLTKVLVTVSAPPATKPDTDSCHADDDDGFDGGVMGPSDVIVVAAAAASVACGTTAVRIVIAASIEVLSLTKPRRVVDIDVDDECPCAL